MISVTSRDGECCNTPRALQLKININTTHELPT